MPLQRCSITDTHRPERLFFQFNPETLVENIDPVWKKRLPLMGSRESSQYMGTKSEVVPMELFFCLVGARGGVGGDEAFPDLEQIESGSIESAGGGVRPSLEGPSRFLKSLCYNDPAILRGGLGGLMAPPLCVFEWPGIVRIQGHIESLQVRYKQFDTRDLRGLTLVASFNFVEDFESQGAGDAQTYRIRNGRVRTMGSIRASEGLIPKARPRRDSRQPTTVVFSRELNG